MKGRKKGRKEESEKHEKQISLMSSFNNKEIGSLS